MLKRSSLILIGILVIAVFVFVGCEKQAQVSKPVKAEAKSSLAAPAGEEAPAGKTAVKKECPKKAEKKVCPKMAAKHCEMMVCAAGDGKKADKNICSEHNGKKYCFCCQGCKKQFEKDPQKCIDMCKAADVNAVKTCPMKAKKACPANCKKPCCVKKMDKCKAADANAPAPK